MSLRAALWLARIRALASRASKARFVLGASVVLLLACWPASIARAQGPEPETPVTYHVNRDDELDVEAVLMDFGTRMGRLVITDPQLRNVRIRFLTSAELNWEILKIVLRMYDIFIIEERSTTGELIIKAYLQRNLQMESTGINRIIRVGEDVPATNELVTAVFQIQHGAGNDIFSALRGFITRDRNRLGNILYIRGSEMIIIQDLALNVLYYAEIIRMLDVPAPGQELRTRRIEYAAAEEVANILTTILRAQAQVATTPGVVPGMIQPSITADRRTNSLIIQAYTHEFDRIYQIIADLDVRVPPPSTNFHIYHCINAKAEDLAQKLNELFTGIRAPPRQPRTSGGGAVPAPVPTPSAAPSSPTSSENLNPALAQAPTRIVADEQTNSLLIQADEGEYATMLQLLRELDRKRIRVFIEAQVWEISTPQDDMLIAFELAAIDNAHPGSVRGFGATNFGQSTINVDLTDQRVTRLPNIANGVIGAINKDEFDKLPLIFRALHNFSESRLLTTSFAITNDNEQASFQITDRFPFVTSTVTGTGIAQENVQFADAVTKLEIEPRVSSEETLTLRVVLDIQSFGAQPAANLPPQSNSRRYEGTVTIPNMRYVIFGGLEQEIDSITESKVPFLGDIPILGHLFKTWSQDRQRTKIYIFIRPVILSDDGFADLNRATEEIRRRVIAISERDEVPEPIIPDRVLRDPYGSVHDRVYELFGTGSANPFPSDASGSEE